MKNYLYHSCFSLLIVVISFGFFASYSKAQELSIGEQISAFFNEDNDGPIASIDDVSDQIASQTPLSNTQAKELINKALDEGSNITPEALEDVFEGFDSGAIPIEEFAAIAKTFDQIQDNLTGNIDSLSGILSAVANGDLPIEIADTLSLLENLGNGVNLDDLEEILKIPSVKAAIEGLLGDGTFPAEITNIITNIANLSLSLDAFSNLSVADLSENIASAIQGALPDVFNGIVESIGIDGLMDTIGLQLFSAFAGISDAIIDSNNTGNYETFARDTKPGSAGGSCTSTCFCTCEAPIRQNHAEIRAHFTDEMIKNRNWLIDVFMKELVLPTMQMMTSQLSAVSMQQTFVIGNFFDAKHQMETTRIFQQLMAEAHRDYQPSLGICEIGTNVRGLASAHQHSRLAHTAMTKRMSDRTLRNNDSISGVNFTSDVASRYNNFKEKYCNVFDNAKGLTWLCAESAPVAERRNKDINITDTLYSKQTIEANFINPSYIENNEDEDPNKNEDGEDILAFTTNLFAPELPPDIERLTLATPEGKVKKEALTYMDLRAVVAKRSIAENAFAAVVAERVSGGKTFDAQSGTGFDSSFMKRIIFDLGVAEDEVDTLLGKNPSYNAQRRILSSYIFENPKFYTQLYESAANVSRKDTAIKTLNLSLEDDFFDRQLEEEAMFAGMLEIMLEDAHTRSNRALIGLNPEGEL